MKVKIPIKTIAFLNRNLSDTEGFLGTQQSGGLFGSKPATGSLFGSTTGNKFI